MTIYLEPLTQKAFAEFGDVIEFENSDFFHINNGTTERYHNLATVNAVGKDAMGIISLGRGDAFHLPLNINMLERHPFGSQAWIPFNQTSFVIIVAPNNSHDQPDENRIKAFLATGQQGVNYHLGTWHHPLISLHQRGDFIIVDRTGSEANCDEVTLSQPIIVDYPQK